MHPAFRALRGVAFAGLVAVGILAQSARWQEVFIGEGVYFLDPDCYSRMTRVAVLEDGHGPALRFHDFENAPAGIVPHTTAPLDFLILGISKALPGSEISPPRDLAGAWVSPLLGLLFLCGIAIWAWPHPHGLWALALAACSPALAHAFAIGRPDHQSLVLALVVAAWIAESRLPAARWVWVASLAWSLALWISLFEPLVLLGLALLMRVVRFGRDALPRDRTGWAAAGAFVALSTGWFIFEGWRFSLPGAGDHALFQRWASSIGELHGAGPGMIFGWAGWLAAFFPLMLMIPVWRKRDRRALTAALTLAVLLVSTLMAARWGYFWVAASVLAVPTVLAVLRPPWLAAGLFLVSLWPVASAWDRQLFPEGEARAVREERRMENLLLRDVADSLKTLPPGNVMAPWWVSPALAYWSDRPFVAGSSHQSLPGIADSARFYLAENSRTAADILHARKVAAVVADDPSRILQNASVVLGVPLPASSVASRLMGGTGPDLPFLKPAHQNRFFRLYEVRLNPPVTTPEQPPRLPPKGEERRSSKAEPGG